MCCPCGYFDPTVRTISVELARVELAPACIGKLVKLVAEYSRNVSNADRGTLFCTFAPCPLAAARFGSIVAVELDHEDFADFDATLANGSDAGPRGHAFYLPTGMLLLMPVASMRSSWASS